MWLRPLTVLDPDTDVNRFLKKSVLLIDTLHYRFSLEKYCFCSFEQLTILIDLNRKDIKGDVKIPSL